ncbi:MAG: PPC domain-containing protein, partial [Planctomycetota bacterium]
EVHFTEDVTDSILNPDFYHLVYTNDTVSNRDDILHDDTYVSGTETLIVNELLEVQVDPARPNVARLLFARPISRTPDPNDVTRNLPGSVRLKIGDSGELPRQAPVSQDVSTDAGDTFQRVVVEGTELSPGTTTVPLSTTAGTQNSVRLTGGEIVNTSDYELAFPGGEDAQGVRNIRPDDATRLDRTVPLSIWRDGADSDSGITTAYYNFPSSWRGDEPNSPILDLDKGYNNLITGEQQQRVREVLSLFSEFLGVQFVEIGDTAADSTVVVPTDGPLLSIAVGELYGTVFDGVSVNSAVGGVTVDTRPLDDAGDTFVGVDPGTNGNELLVMDFQDFDASVDDQTGGEFFRGAFLGIGQLLGYGYSDHLPQPVTQSTNAVLEPVLPTSPDVVDFASQLPPANEALFPSPSDIVNGQYLFRPESNDIDLYRFEVTNPGTLSISTVAERLSRASSLDTALRLYRLDSSGEFVEVAANDDYFSNDSLIEIEVGTGTYVVGVSASGNTNYDPRISGSGIGGVTQGEYDLVITFDSDSADGIVDIGGAALDGDADGQAGGDFNYWFVPSDPDTTIYVDSVSGSGNAGTISAPVRGIDDALSIVELRRGTSSEVQNIRVIGGGSYTIGRDLFGNPLADGAELTVPQGVHLTIEAGSTFRMLRTRIGVGSTTSSTDRSGASLQVLGTPDSPVQFVGVNQTAGNWGGIEFRGDIDFADDSRIKLEDEGVFLNHIQFADIQHGGGDVPVDGTDRVVSPIEMASVRVTVINSTIRNSADAAIAATPDTFEETRFDEARFQERFAPGGTEPLQFVPDYDRIGPHVRGNTIVDNTFNGMQIRLETPSGQGLEELGVNARFDDIDVVHILTENLLIEGNPGGVNSSLPVPPVTLVNAAPQINTTFITDGEVPQGLYSYRLTFVNADGYESSASESVPEPAADPVNLAATGKIRLNNLPVVSAGSDLVGRRLYRANVDPTSGAVGEYRLVARLNGSDSVFVDNAVAGTAPLNESPSRAGRLDAGLRIDPGTILKLDGARIDVTFDAHLYAEGTDEQPIVITSLGDDRYGTGGSFNTSSVINSVGRPGDWSGIVSQFGGDVSIDHAVLSGGGGVSRIDGGFASFNVLESHQSDLRVANTRFEDNADGRVFLNDNANNVNNPSDPREQRAGAANNASGTIFVRGAQPVIVGNTFVNNSGPVATLDVNSFTWQEELDYGRSTGMLDAVDMHGNSGPLIAGNLINTTGANGDCVTDAFAQNRLFDDDGDVITCSLNGIEVRGGRVATEVVWDDTDVVHIVRDMIEVPNQHIYGGLRLESDARGSLVVKFQNQDLDQEDVLLRRQAGIVAGGTLISSEDEFIDIAGRIGGSLQVVGQPDFPVVLTSLNDDTVGAGFTPDGRANVDTDNDGTRVDENGDPILSLSADDASAADDTAEPLPPLLPLGPEFDDTDAAEIDLGVVNGVATIDNDIDNAAVGFFQTPVNAGGQIQAVTVTGRDQNAGATLLPQAYQFLYTTVIDVAAQPLQFIPDPPPVRLIDAAPSVPQLVSPDRVVTSGTYAIPNLNRSIRWEATTFFVDNRAVVYTSLDFEMVEGTFASGQLAGVQVTSYVDQGINENDALHQIGVPGENDFRLLTLDETSRIGFSHGGIYENDTFNQRNAEFAGWAADDAIDLLPQVEANGFNPPVAGDVNNLLPVAGVNPIPNRALGTVPIGPNGNAGDIATALTWDLDDNSNTARVTSFVEFVASDPADPFTIILPSEVDGITEWDGITIREAASDSNVMISAENEPGNLGSRRNDTNATPGSSQFLGELAPTTKSGDETRHLGLIVDGDISSPGDEDVYSFVAEAGTQIWIDIDRTNNRLDTVIELVDANGNTLVYSDDAIAEAIALEQRASGTLANENLVNRRVGADGAAFDIDQVLGLRSTLADASAGDQAFQDPYSTNPKDAGMRLILPGNIGQRGLYYVRVRSAVAESAKAPRGTGENASGYQATGDSLGQGRTTGAYQLQLRIGEDDVFAGTQIRYSDVRYATNGIQIIGGPLHSPLTGEDAEIARPNDTLATAQRLGLYGTQYTDELGGRLQEFLTANPNATREEILQQFPTVVLDDNPALDGILGDVQPAELDLTSGSIYINRDSSGINRVDIDLENPAGPLSTDRLAKNVSGTLDSLTDVDWYQFEIGYRQLTRDDAALYLATVLDIDYADGLARADTAIYVFDANGTLIMIGSDSNIADDQPVAGANYDPSDLSRGSFGSADPYIGAAEMPEGTYFVAVSNQARTPRALEQFYLENPVNPLLRLEPMDSVRRIAEERFTPGFFPGTADAPVQPVLFDDDSFIDYSLDDVLLYVNTGGSLFVVNPFTGTNYGSVGNFGETINDVAFTANGELFGYTQFNGPPADDAWRYVRIDTGNAALADPAGATPGAGISTFHDLQVEGDGTVPQILDVDSDDGLIVEGITIRSRFGTETGFFVANRPQPQQGLEYTTNILYSFDETTGQATGPQFDLSLPVAGAGTDRREVGQIDTTQVTTISNRLGITDASVLGTGGEFVPSIVDGDTFTLFDGTDTFTFEFEQGFTLVASDPAVVPNGTQLTITRPGPLSSVDTTIVLTDNPTTIAAPNVPFALNRAESSTGMIQRLADTIREQGIAVSNKGVQLALPDATGVSLDGPTATPVTGLTQSGNFRTTTTNSLIRVLPTDTAATIAERIEAAVNASSSTTLTATPQDNSVLISGQVQNVSSQTGALVQGGFRRGGSVTGIEMLGGDLFAVTTAGELYRVPAGLLTGSGNTDVGIYVEQSTDLIGLNFTGLRAGPTSVEGGAYTNLLFGITANGDIHAFNTAGRLQPVFAGGRTSISTGIANAQGLDFSTLDYNLWHITGRRGTDEGHGQLTHFADSRVGFEGTNSLAFSYNTGAHNGNYGLGEAPVQNVNGPNENVRQDGQTVQNTYNLPGGAKGTVQSNEFSLEGYTAADLPTMYFTYFLETDGVDSDNDDDGDADFFGEDQDSLRVYVITPDGVEHLVATNNESRGASSFDDEFDDPIAVGAY